MSACGIALYRTVAESARGAAFDDSRFSTVTKEEVGELKVSLSVLTSPQSIHPEQVEIGRHGLLVSLGPYRGLLLPQVPVEHGWNRITFLEQTCMPQETYSTGRVFSIKDLQTVLIRSDSPFPETTLPYEVGSKYAAGTTFAEVWRVNFLQRKMVSVLWYSRFLCWRGGFQMKILFLLQYELNLRASTQYTWYRVTTDWPLSNNVLSYDSFCYYGFWILYSSFCTNQSGFCAT